VFVAVADVNGDGKPDVLVANTCVSINNFSDCFPQTGSVGVLLGNGDGTFQATQAYDTGGTYTDSVVVADVNGDGKPDIIVTNCAFICDYGFTDDGSVGVLLGNGDGTFQPVQTYDSGGVGPVGVSVSDLNGDGNPDLVVINWYPDNDPPIAVLLGNGDGTFQPAQKYSSGGSGGRSILVADVNADNTPDLILANGTITVLLGNGDGSFQDPVTYDSGGWGLVATADINADGKLDLIVGACGDSSCNSGIVGVLLGNGDGTFQAALVTNTSASLGRQIAIADFDGDGHLDVASGSV